MENPAAAADRYAWLSRAACVRDPKYRRQLQGFAGSSISKQALALCQSCPVRLRCLQHAYDHGAEFGYFGGVAPSRRRNLGSYDAAVAWIEATERADAAKGNGRAGKRRSDG